LIEQRKLVRLGLERHKLWPAKEHRGLVQNWAQHDNCQTFLDRVLNQDSALGKRSLGWHNKPLKPN
jgi:hypothetical protein